MRSDLEQLAERLRRAAEAGDCAAVAPALEGSAEEERTELRRQVGEAVRATLAERAAALRAMRAATPAEQLALLRRWSEQLRHTDAWTRSATACRLVMVGVGNRREVETALFNERNPLAVNWERGRDWRQGYSYHAGLLLLARDVPWRDEVLLRILSQEGRGWAQGLLRPSRLELGLELLRRGVLNPEEALPPLATLAATFALTLLDWDDPWVLAVVEATLELRGESLASQGGPLQEKIAGAASAGRLDRDRTLGLALQRLAEESRAHDANWWAGLVETLAPTDDEWVAHQVLALDLVAAPTARAATVGLNAAKRLRRKSAVASAELLPVLSVAVGGSTQQLAKGAVGLLREVAKAEPACRDEALASALGALSHPKAQVAEAVAAWLEADTWWRGEAELREAVQGATAGATPAIAARLGALLGEPVEAPAAIQPDGDPLPVVRERLAAAQAGERDPRRRDWLAACLSALDGGPVPEPLDPVPVEELWRAEPAFEPPESAEQVARLMLVPERLFQDRLAQEQVLAGVRVHPAGAEAESLRRLLEPVLDHDKVGPLAWTWVTRKAPEPLPLPRPPYDWEYRRMAAIEALLRGDRAPPLGTPTTTSGWLDPEVFAERLVRRSEVTGYGLFELSSALYRLAPTGREAAWERLAGEVRRFGARVGLALHTALGPADSAGLAATKLRALVTASPGPLWLRLLVAALWCRDSSGPVRLGPVLMSRAKLTLGFGLLGDHLWHAGLLPDQALVPGAKVVFIAAFGELAAFTAPALAPALVERLVRTKADGLRAWEQPLVGPVLRLAGRPQVALRPVLRGLVELLDHGQPDAPPALAELLAAGLADARLRSDDVASALAGRLGLRSAKPAQTVQALAQLRTELGGPDLAAVCLELAVAAGLGDLTGAQRVQILEALLAVRGELARPVEDPGAVAALRGMAAAKGGTRTTQLAKQLLALPAGEGATSRQRCAALDVEAALRASRGLTA